MQGSPQDLAWAGFSCTKNRPPSTCCLYSFATNSMWRMPSASCLVFRSLSCTKLCSWLNATHGGLPISTRGFSLSTYSSACRRCSAILKSHPVVRSIASPTSMPNLTACSLTLGGENTSHTSTVHRRCTKELELERCPGSGVDLLPEHHSRSCSLERHLVAWVAANKPSPSSARGLLGGSASSEGGGSTAAGDAGTSSTTESPHSLLLRCPSLRFSFRLKLYIVLAKEYAINVR